ncbi:MAG: site-specific integrase [Halopseudomonas aestusnigri]
MGNIIFVSMVIYKMASFSIQKRKKNDGTIRYTGLIRVRKNGKLIHSESRTFAKQATAKSWGKQRVAEIEISGHDNKNQNISLGELIQKYLDDPHIELGRTKRKVLELVADCDVAKVDIFELKSHHLVQHCKDRKESGTGKSTINHDVSYIRSVLKMAKPAWGYEINDQAVIDSYPVLHDMQLIGKSNRRNRRPTSIELEKLIEKLKNRSSEKGAFIPYVDLLEFSILSCMRIGEVCSILWDDVNDEQKAVLVRDRKDPRKKAGNHMLVPLLGGSWEILKNQPKTDERIFPYNSKSVSAGFQRARNSLGIKDLRYHDLRREGASRLFEKGYSIDEVAQVTGHRNINTLWQVYTELMPNRLHDKDER